MEGLDFGSILQPIFKASFLRDCVVRDFAGLWITLEACLYLNEALSKFTEALSIGKRSSSWALQVLSAMCIRNHILPAFFVSNLIMTLVQQM